ATREEHRKTATAAHRAEEKVRTAWRDFDRVRDGLARLGPPPADRDDLAAAWSALAGWTGQEPARRDDARTAAAAAPADAEREAQVARTLAVHLRANNFERWLLEEALDSLVDGASRILRELSAGQYDLGHDRGDFFVVDHHDAGLRRAVRTLSGGETFQASL